MRSAPLPRAVRCCADGCSTKIGTGKLFCQDHYFALPRTLRDTLWTSWRLAMECYRKSLPRDEQERRRGAYGEAYRACQDYLRTARPNIASAATTVAAEAGRSVIYVGGRML